MKAVTNVSRRADALPLSIFASFEGQQMLSNETLERYRRMTTSERAAIVVQSMRENWSAMFEGSDETIRKRFELLRRQNDERNRNMLEGLARTRTDAS